MNDKMKKIDDWMVRISFAESGKPELGDDKGLIRVGKGFSSNDANHISGPSRSGEGAFRERSSRSRTPHSGFMLSDSNTN